MARAMETPTQRDPRWRRSGGAATGSLLLLLLILVAAGGYNYYRNWTIEKQSEGKRPYRSYAVEDLESLRSAYQQELAGTQQRFDRARASRVRPDQRGGSISENIDQFSRTTRTSHAIREAAGEVAERQRQISEIDRELELRASFGQGLMRHWKRLVTI